MCELSKNDLPGLLKPIFSVFFANYRIVMVYVFKVFFQDDTKDGMAGAAIASNASLVVDAVRCMPLPVSRMPSHAVPLGEEMFSVCSEDQSQTEEPDLTVLLTRPCLSFNEVRLGSMAT